MLIFRLQFPAVLLAAALYLCGSQKASAVSLACAPAFPVAANSTSLVTADLNGDGVPDIVAISGYPSAVSILIGKGDGSFRPATQLPLTAQPTLVTVADINGDGKPDLIVACSGAVNVLLGNGDGTFQAAVSFASDSAPTALATGDFNGDGKLDIVIANSNAGQVYVMSGGTSPLLGAPISYPVGTHPFRLVCGDFNKDGISDVAVADYLSATISVLLSNGSGGFSPPVTYAIGSSAQALTTCDLNGDGNLDLVAISLDSVSVLTGSPSGTFGTARTYSTFQASSFAIGDFDGDGHPDIAVLDYAGVSILLGNGDGTLQAAVNTTNIPTGGSLYVADLDGDGKQDLILSGRQCVAEMRSLGAGMLSTQRIYASGINVTQSIVMDLNRDGAPDVVVLDGSNIRVLLGRPSAGGALLGASARSDVPGATNVALIDVNGDGKLDLIAINYFYPTPNPFLTVSLGNGDGTFQAPVTLATNLSAQSLVIGDFNGDGMADIAVISSPTQVSIYLNTGNGTFGPAIATVTGQSPSTLATGDVNGDGKLDLIVGNASPSPGTTVLLLGNGDGTFQAPTTIANFFSSAIAVGDVNSDGHLDLALTSRSPYFLDYLQGNGDGSFASPLSFSGIGGSYVAIGDINNDGRLDIFASNAFLSALLNTGSGFSAPVALESVYSPFYSITDINGDGKLDILYTTQYGVSVGGYLGNGDGTFQAPISWPICSNNNVVQCAYAVGDLNGDGKPDILAYGIGSSILTALIAQPTVATPTAAAMTSATTASLGVLGGNIAPGWEGALSYTWSAVGPGPVSYSDNATNTAKNCTATLAAGGVYTLTCTMRNTAGDTAQSSVTLIDSMPVARLSVTPGSATVGVAKSQSFTVAAFDSASNSIALPQTAYAWSAGGGALSVSAAGATYTAGIVPGIYSVRASINGRTRTAPVTVVGLPSAPGNLIATSP